MIDSESVAVGGEVPPGPTDRLVVAKARRQGEKAQCDTHADPGEGAPAVALQGELALAGPKDRLDPLAHRPQGAVSAPLPLAIGAHQARPDRKGERRRYGSLGAVRQWIESVFW